MIRPDHRVWAIILTPPFEPIDLKKMRRCSLSLGRRTDRFHCKSGTQKSNKNGNFQFSEIQICRQKNHKNRQISRRADFIFQDTVSDVGRGNLAISKLLALKKCGFFLRSTYYWMSRSTHFWEVVMGGIFCPLQLGDFWRCSEVLLRAYFFVPSNSAIFGDFWTFSFRS